MNPTLIGIIKKAFISDCDVNSPSGGIIEIPVEIFRSAEAQIIHISSYLEILKIKIFRIIIRNSFISS